MKLILTQDVPGLGAPGDVVEVRHTGGPPLDQAHNGDWSVPWDQWVRGSAKNSGAPPPPSPLSVTSAPGP